MKTAHTVGSNYDFNKAIWNALTEVGNREDYRRIVTCGKGVIILPDANRTKDCEMPELLKALGLRDKAEPATPPASATEDYLFHCDDVHWRVLLTPDQVRLIDWLSYNNLLADCLDWNPLDKPEII